MKHPLRNRNFKPNCVRTCIFSVFQNGSRKSVLEHAKNVLWKTGLEFVKSFFYIPLLLFKNGYLLTVWKQEKTPLKKQKSQTHFYQIVWERAFFCVSKRGIKACFRTYQKCSMENGFEIFLYFIFVLFTNGLWSTV